MASLHNLQDKVVKGGRFVPVSTSRVSAKDKLKDIRVALASADGSDASRYLEEMLSDNVISVSEKESLKSRWDQARVGYSRLKSAIRDAFGDEELASFAPLEELYASLYSMLSSILQDMDSDSTSVPPDFSNKFNEFTSRYAEISLTYSMYLSELTRYSIYLDTDKASFSDGEFVNVYCHLLKDSTEVKEDYRDYEVEWHIHGADISVEDKYFIEKAGDEIVKQGISFPASLFEGAITIDCSMNVPIENSLLS